MKTILVSLSICIGLLHAEWYTNHVPKYREKKSTVVVRSVKNPTLANLDFMAYHKNAVRYDSKKYRPKKPEEKVTLQQLTFKGSLQNVVDNFSQTPVTEDEYAKPMAWQPLENKLWEVTKEQRFISVANRIPGNKWNDFNIIAPYQSIVAVWLHTTKEGKKEFWCEVEFARWVKFLSGVTDNDDDGVKEIYGKLDFSEVPDSTYQKAIAWIESEYQRKKLSQEEITDWANILASYWYPSLNTDILAYEPGESWPFEDTEKKVKKQLKGFVVDNPIAVIRGNPSGKPIYNVYFIEGAKQTASTPQSESSDTNAVQKKLEQKKSENFTENMRAFKDSLAYYGSYDAWADSIKSKVSTFSAILQKTPEDRMGIEGKDSWVFFRKTLEYIVGGSLIDQPRDKNPLEHIVEFKEYLNKHNIEMLFMPIPTKAEVYPEKLSVDLQSRVVNPYNRQLLHELQKHGVEVIDLLPAFLEAKTKDESMDEYLYQLQDTHWTNRGLQIAAKVVAERIKTFAWYKDSSEPFVSYTTHDTTFDRLGDIVSKLPESKRTSYPPVTLQATQVLYPDGKLYRGKAETTAPIMLIGDSFTGVFELVDCKGAGLGAHIAEKTQIPTDIITSWGGGPLVRKKALRARDKYLGQKRVVIYTMVARDLFNYSQGWQDLEEK